MSELSALAERMEEVDSANYLGRLAWYSVSEMRVPHADVIRGLAAAGILTDLPWEPTDTDIFKRVCTSANRKRVATADPAVFENYTFTQFRDTNTVTRRLVKEVVDHRGKRLNFTEVADLVFNRSDSKIAVTGCMEGIPTEIIDEVLSEFALWRGCLNAYAIREWIRAFIMRLGATRVRPGGGVYFVAESHFARLEALEAFGNGLPGDCEFHSLPLIDDRKQRGMLRRAFEAETAGALNELLEEVGEISKAGKPISADKYAKYLTQYQELSGKTKDYAGILEDTLQSTGSLLTVFQKSLMNLTLLVKE